MAKNINTKKRVFLLLSLLILFIPNFAWAHQSAGSAQGFLSGFFHPTNGFDHVIAMVAVGLWGGILGKPSVWMLPVAFPMVMAFGGMLGVNNIDIPYIEVGIALSGIVLGIMILFYLKPKLWIALAIVAIFAIFHGHAHGTELPNAANPMTYAFGFVLSTGLLHISGIILGLLIHKKWGKVFVRGLGGSIAVIGLYFFIISI